MKKELQEKLFETYPKIFRQKDLRSCMARGIECSDGWYNLIEMACRSIQRYIDNNESHHPFAQVEFAQVKEKFGSLTIYTEFNRDDYEFKRARRNKFLITQEDVDVSMSRFGGWVDGVISFASTASVTICEITGKPGCKRIVDGWHVTLCDEEYEAALKRRAEGGLIKC